MAGGIGAVALYRLEDVVCDAVRKRNKESPFIKERRDNASSHVLEHLHANMKHPWTALTFSCVSFFGVPDSTDGMTKYNGKICIQLN
jgi:hypothetical protein